MSAILAVIPWEWLAGLAALIAAAFGIYAKGRGDAKTDAKIKQAEADAATNERINHADTMRDADDDARIERLRRFERDNRP